MTDTIQSADADRESESIDPAMLRERSDVTYEESTTVHDVDHYESHSHDTAVVGVTNDDGAVCCFVNAERAFAGLPWEQVSDGDWLDAAHAAIENWCTGTGMAITVDGVALVRRVDHELADDEPRATTHTILFHATPVKSDPDLENLTGAADWDAGWYDDVPAVATETPDEIVADIRRFVG